MISLTTAKIDVKTGNGVGENNGSDNEDNKSENDEPDEHAVPAHQYKRNKDMIGSPASVSSQKNPYNNGDTITSAAAGNEYEGVRSSKSGKKNKQRASKNHNLHIQYDHNSHKAGSNGSVTVSMRDDSIMHMSVNSVTDNNFIIHKGEDT